MENGILYGAIILAGFFAGFINTIAGSGSLITLPLLIFSGLPPTVANGTNRIGVLLQNLTAAHSFHNEKIMDLRGVITLGIPAIVGSLIGAQIAVNLDEETMRQVIGILMLVLLVVILIRPKRWLKGSLEKISGIPAWWQIILFFLIGMYGGFIQAGVGIFLLSGLVLGMGYDLLLANAVKVGIVLLFTISSLVVFISNSQVNFFYGGLLAIGSVVGGWAGAKVAVERGTVWVRRLLVAVILVSAVNLLGIFDFVSN